MALMPAAAVGIQRLAYAISVAEGFWAGAGDATHTPNVPQRAHNPGNIKVPGWTSPTTGAEHIPMFLTVEEGWKRLYVQLQRIINGASAHYTLGMSLAQMSEVYTDTDTSNWGTIVAGVLGVPVTTTLRTLLVPLHAV